MHPFTWGVAYRDIVFTIIFFATLLYTFSKIDRVKLFCLIFLICIFYLGGTIFAINQRYHSAAWAFVHDSVLQNEIAGRMLLLGKNPYAENYIGSELEKWPYKGESTEKNPALYHLTAMPMILYLNALPQTYFARIFHFFDGRVIYLFMFVLFLILIIKYMKRDTYFRNLFLILFFLNPIAIRFYIDGRNDFFVIVLLFVSTYLLEKHKYLQSAFILGLAFSSKLTIWPILPFIILFIVGNSRDKKRITFFYLLTVLVTVCVLVAPFLILNNNSFIKSIFSFYNGGGLENYPISGFGFSKLLVGMGYIHSVFDRFPFWILQLVVGIPALYILLKRQIHNNKISSVYINYGIFMLITWYFSHHFNDNYMFYIVQILTIGLFIGLQSKKSKKIRKYVSLSHK
jgi:hypothetical protein